MGADPGIPKAWPFKEELVAQLQAQRDAHVARERAKHEAARKRKVRGRGRPPPLLPPFGYSQSDYCCSGVGSERRVS